MNPLALVPYALLFVGVVAIAAALATWLLPPEWLGWLEGLPAKRIVTGGLSLHLGVLSLLVYYVWRMPIQVRMLYGGGWFAFTLAASFVAFRQMPEEFKYFAAADGSPQRVEVRFPGLGVDTVLGLAVVCLVGVILLVAGAVVHIAYYPPKWAEARLGGKSA